MMPERKASSPLTFAFLRGLKEYPRRASYALMCPSVHWCADYLAGFALCRRGKSLAGDKTAFSRMERDYENVAYSTRKNGTAKA